jgi:hypothetical protein
MLALLNVLRYPNSRRTTFQMIITQVLDDESKGFYSGDDLVRGICMMVMQFYQLMSWNGISNTSACD